MRDVVIVGGGPVGTLLAYELGLHGVRTVVLERERIPSTAAKAGTLHARTASSSTGAGCWRRWHSASRGRPRNGSSPSAPCVSARRSGADTSSPAWSSTTTG